MGSNSNVLPCPLEDIRTEIARVLGSRTFAQSPRQARLLDYLCNKVLLGEADQIKEYTVAVEIFGRSSEFNENKDAVVRVEAHRLRKRLSKYYEEEGTGDRIRIDIPSGQYVPRFQAGEGVRPTAALNSANDIPEVSAPALSAVSAPALPAGGSRRSARIWASLVGALVLGVSGFVAFRSHPGSPSPEAARSRLSYSAAAGVAEEVRIRAGATTAEYIDRSGRLWQADRYFEGGEARPGPSDFVGRPPDPGLFQTIRVGDFAYHIPLKAGVYEMRLYFAEPEFRANLDVGGSGENQRRFDISLNGRSLLEDFDVVSDSGIAPVSIRAFKDVAPAADGKLHLKFSADHGQAVVSAIELVPGIPGRLRPIRFRAHDMSYTDRSGNFWTPDNYFVNGRLATHRPIDVTGTSEPELYACERYGNFSYVIPVAPGTYRLTLRFAETWFHQGGTAGGGAGSRVFDVTANGVALLRDFDAYLEAGGAFKAVDRTFRGLTPNGQGRIVLCFSPWKNYAAVKAVELIDESD